MGKPTLLFKNKCRRYNEIANNLEELNGKTFKHLNQIKAKLQKILKRTLSSEELEFLGQKLHFKTHQTILHLTVYDGGIAQALRFETEAYLRMFNRLLPELKLNNLPDFSVNIIFSLSIKDKLNHEKKNFFNSKIEKLFFHWCNCFGPNWIYSIFNNFFSIYFI